MRILFISQWFEPEPTFKALGFAKALVARGHDVEVITGFPNYPTGKIYPGYKLSIYQRETMDGITVHRVPLYLSHDHSSLRRIVNYLSFSLSAAIFACFRARRFDVIYAYPQVTVGLAAAISGLLCRRPVVLDIQDLWPDTVLKSGMRGAAYLGPVLNLLCRFVYDRSTRIVAQSKGMKRRLQERGVAGDKIAVIYNWADEDDAIGKGLADLEPYGFVGKFNIVFGGNLGRVQGLDTLVRAAAAAGQQVPQIQLLLIGNGIEAPMLNELVQQLGTSNVRIAPGIPRDKIGDVFAAADVLVLHLWKDPLFEITIPSKTQFYLAMGKPILIGVQGEAAQIVAAAGAGLAVEPENVDAMAQAMIELATSPKDRLVTMGQRGRETYEADFAFAGAIAATEDVLRSAVMHHQGRGASL